MIDTTAGPFPLHVNPITGEISASTVQTCTADDLLAVPPFSTQSYSAASSTPLLRIAIGGEYASVTRPIGPDPRPREWKRGNVQNFSPRSRSRMLQSLAKTDTRGMTGRAWFITLTWPREWVAQPYRWKEMLEAWRKRLARLYPDAWYFWKIEFQKRGAPHFHLLMFGPARIDTWQLHQNWYEIVGSFDKYHWRYGVDVQLLKEWKQVGQYCSKYAAKVDESTQEGSIGRYWGIASRANRRETVCDAEVTDEEFFKIRRVFKRLIMAANGYHAAGGPYSGVWVRISNVNAKRVLAWAASTRPPPLPNSTTPLSVRPYGRGRLADDNDSSSRWYSTVVQPNPTGRTTDKPNTPVFDALDVHAVKARRLLR